MAWMMHKKEGKMARMGKMAHMMESHANKIPMALICAAGVCAVASIAMKCMHKRHGALTAGQFIAPLMLMGMYKKMEAHKHGKHEKFHHRKHHGDCGCW